MLKITDYGKVSKKDIQIKCKILKNRLSKNYLKIYYIAYIINKNNYPIGELKINLGKDINEDIELNEFSSKLNKKDIILKNKIKVFKVSVKDIIEKNIEINNSIFFSINVLDQTYKYNLCMKNKRISNTKLYYIPLKALYVDEYAISLRRTSKGNLLLNKRLKEGIEDTLKFKIYESNIISLLFYNLCKIYKKVSNKKINLYYEKFSSKAEEGVFELCRRTQNSVNSKNYFIIDKNAINYSKIAKCKFVIKKYSLKYYWFVYRANNLISTEAPMHVGILRSINKFFRKSVYEKKNIFLQHGIIYMKNLGVDSAFIKGKEAEPNYIVVSSQKEKEVVHNMLNIDNDFIWVTGLAVLDKVKYNHINKDSSDVITIMLTWKPYEEHLYNFEESTYYKNVINIYNLLLKYVDKNQIYIVPHPKVAALLKNTHLGNRIWKEEISKILTNTKLLITDYSSVCYNSFYQGAAVVFYQEDLEKYEQETGKLIPSNEEYIGKRAFCYQELEEIFDKNIIEKKIILKNLRTKKHINNYKEINEFCDGKNSDRILNKLIELKMI